MMARGLLNGCIMDVGLLTNALISNLEVVSGLSESAVPTSAVAADLESGEGAASADQTQLIASDNILIGAPGQLVQDTPTKDFRQVLEEQMQAETPSDQSYPVPADAPNDLSAASDGPVLQAADLPQQELVVQNSQVLTEVLYNLVLSAPVYLSPGQDYQTSTGSTPAMAESADAPDDLSAASEGPVPQAADLPQQELVVHISQALTGVFYNSVLSAPVYLSPGQDNQTGTGSTPGMPESADAIAELASQMEFKVIQPAQGNAATALDVQHGEGVQAEPRPTANEAFPGGQGAPAEAKNGGLVGESFMGSDAMALEQERSPDPVQQATVNAQPVCQADSGVVKAVSSGSEPATQENSRTISGSNYEESSSGGSMGRQTNVPSEYSDGSVMGASLGEESLSGDSIAQKVNVAQSDAPAAQAKGSNTQTSDGGGSFNFEGMVPVENVQDARTEHPGAAQSIKSTANPAADDTYSSAGEQIRESIRSSIGGPDREITVRLNPPELGRVVIKLQQHEDQITGILEVSRSQTRAEVQQELPGIARDLLELGVHVKRLDVVMTGEQEQQTLSGWSAMAQQNGWDRQQGTTSPNPNAPYALENELIAEDSEYTGFTGRSRSYVTEKSIDMFA